MSVNNSPLNDLKRRHKKLIIINIIFFIVLIIYYYLIPSVFPGLLPGIILLSDYGSTIQVIFIIIYLAWLISLFILIVINFIRIRQYSIKTWPLSKLEIFSLLYTLALITLWIYARINSIDITFYYNDIY